MIRLARSSISVHTLQVAAAVKEVRRSKFSKFSGQTFLVTYAIAPRFREGEACAADDPTACGQASKVSRLLLWGSAVIWSCGFFFVAYLLGPILERMD
jgi:hypothetical protein